MTYSENAPTQREYDYNVTGQRILAALVDIVLMLALLLFVEPIVCEVDISSGISVSLNGPPAVLYFRLVFAYFVLAEGRFGATVGKQTFGLNVIGVEGTPCDWGRIIIRNVLRVVDGFQILYMVRIMAILITLRNQRIGDLTAKTLVVRLS